MAVFCVLTGDLVASSDLTPQGVDTALHCIETAANDMSDWWTPTVKSRFARRGGDGWQVALDAPLFALRAALFIQACLRRDSDTTTRIALATGTGILPETGDLNAAHGPVFVASGRLLGKLSGNTRLAHADGGASHAATRLADHIASGWTQAQARAVAALLPPNAPNRADVAKSIGITRQAVNQALWSAGFPAIADALDAIETEQRK
ncbi:MAG: MarR family transcriptional regulator [Rhodobacteraceae bacterium]|nr:MarR family transcriptional regulator [Paracoccaceae bacterium]